MGLHCASENSSCFQKLKISQAFPIKAAENLQEMPFFKFQILDHFLECHRLAEAELIDIA